MFEVLSTSGDTHLGGDDFDKVAVTCLCHLMKHFLVLSCFFFLKVVIAEDDS